MPLPTVGDLTPDFTLAGLNGGRYNLAETAQRGPALVAFFKRVCATSGLALPFVERLHGLYPALQVLGLSQDGVEDTAAFAAEARLTFPVLLDSDWKVSAAYDLFAVPTLFLLDGGGRLARTNLGWNVEQYNALSDEVARLLHVPAQTLVTGSDQVPAHKPG